MARNNVPQGNPEAPTEMTDRDRILRGVLTGLAEKNFAVALLQNGEVAIHMGESDYTLKLTKKKERVI